MVKPRCSCLFARIRADLDLFCTKSTQNPSCDISTIILGVSLLPTWTSERYPVHVQLDFTLFCHDAAEVRFPGNLELPYSLLFIFKLEEKPARHVADYCNPVE